MFGRKERKIEEKKLKEKEIGVIEKKTFFSLSCLVYWKERK